MSLHINFRLPLSAFFTTPLISPELWFFFGQARDMHVGRRAHIHFGMLTFVQVGMHISIDCACVRKSNWRCRCEATLAECH